MNIRRSLMLTLAMLGMLAGEATAQRVVPSALLTIDHNRTTVVERIVGEWGDRLARSNAGIDAAQLREILSGLRSDHLLAASLAGSVEGLRDVVSGALVRTDAAISPTLKHTKALGDITDDLVYTPIVPCRIVDTRSGGGGVFLPGNQRDWRAFNTGGFAAQGGSATNCGIPVRPVAIMANTTLANTVGGPEFFTLWPFNQARPNASTVNWWASAQQPANGEIVPLCTGGGCTSDFSAYASGQTHAIIDVLGYFNRPTNYAGIHAITGVWATGGGGLDNTASGQASTVAGGEGNTASGIASTVAGGSGNAAGGGSSTVTGGFNNIASGIDSTVAGGFNNIASGGTSFAAGHDVLADIAGCAVFGFFSSGLANCKGVGNIIRVMGNHGFTIDWGSATGNGGGAFWVEINDLTPGRPINVYNNAYLSAGGVWTSNSDRNKKEHFAAVDPQTVLAKLVALPVRQWSYKAEPGVSRMGPVAQDFHAAFGLGPDELTIAQTDEAGVAFAAIQGLHQKMRHQMRSKDKQIAQLKEELRAIKAKLGM